MNEMAWFLIADLLGCLLIVLLLSALTGTRPRETRKHKTDKRRGKFSAYAIREA